MWCSVVLCGQSPFMSLSCALALSGRRGDVLTTKEEYEDVLLRCIVLLSHHCFLGC